VLGAAGNACAEAQDASETAPKQIVAKDARHCAAEIWIFDSFMITSRL
jgi:hypothetical protein